MLFYSRFHFRLRTFRKIQKHILCVTDKKNYSEEASFECKPCELFKLQSKPATTAKVSKTDAIKFYEQMIIIRRMENVSAHLYTEKLIRGFLHLYSGQEAICVGLKAVMRPQDTVITAYRAHGWTYIMDGNILGVIAELMGRQSGCSRGKGGSMHTYAKHFFGGNGIVGAQVPLGTGLAFAHKYAESKGVCVTLYGDGAANQGQIFEAYNIAKLWQLPVIYVCENNKYGMGTSTKRASANTNFYTRGDYIPGLQTDGMDVLNMREVGKFAIDWCMKGNGPIIIEAITYRYFGHSMSDPGVSYRSRDEVQNVRQTQDPITTFKNKIVKAKLVTEDEIKKIDDSTKKAIDSIVSKAKADKEPGKDELTSDIYSLNLMGKIRNALPWTKTEHKRIGPAINIK